MRTMEGMARVVVARWSRRRIFWTDISNIGVVGVVDLGDGSGPDALNSGWSGSDGCWGG